MRTASRLAACAACGFITVAAYIAADRGLVAQAQPAAARVSVLEGAPNFRDVGGYATKDGRHVRRGLVYRSNQLSDLTAADYEKLAAMRIKLVCDLRTDGERSRQPTRWQGREAPEIMVASILKETDIAMSTARLRELTITTSSSSAALGSAYERMVTPEAAAEYGRLYKRIAAGDLPLIAHCSAGKDRTGVFSAVLLTLLDVPRSSVIDDYMLTGEYMATNEALTKAAADFQKIAGAAGAEPLTVEQLRAVYTMHAEVLTGTFATIDKLYGSFEAFVRDGLNLAPADVASVRTRLLE